MQNVRFGRQNVRSVGSASGHVGVVPTVPPMPDLVPRFLTLVDAHRSDPNTSVETLAEALSMTSRHLRRLLVARCGEAPSALLRRRRVEHAERLLAAGATLRGAACAAGYTDLCAFNRAFRAVTGRAPASGPGSPGARPAAVRASRDETADRPMQRESASHPAGVGSAHVR